MDITKILAYQEAVIAREKIIEASKEDEFYVTVRKIQVLKKRLELEKENIAGVIKAYNDSLNTILEGIENIKKELEYLKNENIDELDVKSVEKNLEYLTKYENELKDLNKQNVDGWDSLVKANREATKNEEEMQKLIKAYEPLKAKIPEFNNKLQEDVDAATKKIKEIEKSILPEEVAIYVEAMNALKANKAKQLKASQCALVFVKENDGYCKCGIALDPDTRLKLHNDGYVKCPNCGKIVYKA